MKLLPLIAFLPLMACTQDPLPNNQAGADAGNGARTAATENVARPAPAERQSAAGERVANGSATLKSDASIRGERARQTGSPASAEADPCGASNYQWLVGRRRTAIPASPVGRNWRVACTSCAVTMDYSPERLNIFYDSETERVAEVRCG